MIKKFQPFVIVAPNQSGSFDPPVDAILVTGPAGSNITFTLELVNGTSGTAAMRPTVVGQLIELPGITATTAETSFSFVALRRGASQGSVSDSVGGGG